MGSLLNLSSGALLDKVLPYDAEVEYIQSSTGQYIDTGIVLDYDYYIEIDYACITNNNAFLTILGSNTASGQGYSVPLGINSSGIVYTQVGGGDDYVSAVKANDGIMRHYISYSERNYIKLNLNGSVYTAPKGSSPISNRTMYLLGRNVGGTLMYTGNSRLGKTMIKIKNELVRDYIPVRIGQTGYMYDKVSGQLFGNSGSSAFIPGPDV